MQRRKPDHHTRHSAPAPPPSQDFEDSPHRKEKGRGRRVAGPGSSPNVVRVAAFAFVGTVATIALIGGMRRSSRGVRRGYGYYRPPLPRPGAAAVPQQPGLPPAARTATRPHPGHEGGVHEHHEHADGPPPQPQRLPPRPGGHDDEDGGDGGDNGGEVGDAGGGRRRTSAEATAAMLRQPSSWVDGEKRLKAELAKLHERQKKGLDRGVKVLTRWLGDDVPVWVPKEDEAEWQKKVDARMAELQREEDAFWDGIAREREGKADVRESREDSSKGAGDESTQKGVQDGAGAANADGGKAGGDKEGEKGDAAVDDEKAGGHGDVPSKSAGMQKDGSAPDGKEYPSPAAMVGSDAVVLLEPTFGQHRPEQDAIFAFAEGYDIKIYLAFIESLKMTGFAGDIVLSVSSLPKLKPGVEAYLRAQPNLVVYTVDWTCYTGSGKEASGPKEGMRMCQLNGMYGLPDDNSPDARPNRADDPREARPVATARYELYWAWSLMYSPHSWIMLIDSRDTYFQTDPFKRVEREKDTHAADGLLYFFEENAKTTTIGESSFNRRWLETAYGNEAVAPFFDKAVVCSGSTMGEQIAIESYLRAMVAQFDETKCKVKGCDQGFHNYLHYSRTLENAKGIRSTVVHEQGKGIINNLGLLRDKPLRERGIINAATKEVLNWDKSVSPVAHQFDRDDELKQIVNKRKNEFMKKWRQSAEFAQ